MTSPAEKEGMSMLRKYRSEKIQSRNQSKSPVRNTTTTYNNISINDKQKEITNDGIFEAIAEGSRLGLMYSASKRRDIGHRSTLLDITNELPDNDKEALEMLRIALSQLTDNQIFKEDDKHSRIVSMLKGVEERLESSAKNNPIASYSPSLNRRDLSAIMNMNNESGIRTPVLDRSGFSGSQRIVMKTYMDNQLELNEKEGQEYENKFNELYEMLTDVENERDDYRNLCDELKEQFQKDRELLDDEMTAATKSWDSERELLTSTIDTLKADVSQNNRTIQMEEEKNNILLSQLERLQQSKASDDEKINNLFRELDDKKASIENLKISIEEFKLDSKSLKDMLKQAIAESEELRMQNSTLTLRANEASILEKKIELYEATTAQLKTDLEHANELASNTSNLEATIANLRNEVQMLDERCKYTIVLEDNVNSMNNTVDELRQELIRSQARANEADQLQNMIVNLNIELNSSKDEVTQLSSKIKLLKGEVEEKVYLNKSIEITLEGEREIAKQLQLRTQSLGEELEKARSDLLNMTNERDTSISKLDMSSIADDDDSMHTAVGGSNRKSLTNQQKDRSILNVYMDNTLDLNMKEMEYYETALDDLEKQLAKMTEERDELRGFYDQWERDKDQLDATIEQLQSEIEDKNKVIEDLIDEKNRLEKGDDSATETLTADLLEAKKEISRYKSLLESKDLEVEMASSTMFEMQKQFDEIKLQIIEREKDRSRHGKSYSRTRATPAGISATPSLFHGEGMINTPGDMSLASQFTRFTNDEFTELQKAVKQKEDLTKFQISQLHLLQDSLSEQKKANVILKDHKKGLKDMVDKMKQQLDDSNTQINILKISCQSYQTKVEEVERMLEDATRSKDTTNMNLLETQKELNQYQEKENNYIRLNGELLIQIEELNNKIKTSTNDLTGNKATQAAKRRIEELTTQISNYVRQNDDFKIENGKLQSELKLKVSLVDELTETLNKSRDDLQSCLSELAEMKSDGMQSRNESNYIIEEKDKSISKLNEMIEDYELQHAELNASIQEKEAELLEKSVSFYIDNGNDDDDEQVQYLTEQLKSKSEAAAFFEQEVTVLQMKLSGREPSSKDKSPIHIRIIEKEREIDILKEIVDELENELAKNKKQLYKIQNENKFIKDLLDSQNMYSKKCEEELLKKVNFFFNKQDIRLKNVNQMVSHLHNDKVKGTKNDIQQKLEETQYALKQAVEKAEADYAERQYLLNQLEISQQEQEFLDRTLEEVKMEQENRNKANEAYMNDEYSKLQERLEVAEKRATEMSTNGTKAFAKSARTIGYLEGEALRLRNLVDHFRIINVKLSSDLKAANEEGMKAKSLEHRLQTLVVTEEQLLTKTKQLEALLQTKEAELISMQRMIQELEERKLEDYETEINQLHDKIRVTENSLSSITKEFKQLQVSASETEQSTRLEIQNLNDNVAVLKEELQKKVSLINANDQNVKSLQKTIREKDNSLADIEAKLLSLRNEDAFNQAEWNHKYAEYEKELQEKNSINDQLETKVATIVSQISELEESIALKDEMIATTLSRQAAASEELRQKRLALEISQTEVANLNSTVDELRSAVEVANQDLVSIKEQYTLLKNTTHHEALLKLADSEIAMKNMSYELDNVTKDLGKANEHIGSLKEMLESTEQQIDEMRAKNITLSAEEQVLHANVESLNQDNKQLKAYLDESNSKLSLAQEMILKYEDDNHHLIDIQSQMKWKLNSLEVMKESEVMLANEMKSFTASMLNGLNLSIRNATNDDDGGDNNNVNGDAAKFFENDADFDVQAEISSMIRDSSVDHDDSSLNLIRQAFKDLRSKSETLLAHDSKLSESLRRVSDEIFKSNSICKRLEEDLISLTSQNHALESKYNNSEEEVKRLKDEVFAISREKAELFTSIEESSVTMEYQLKRIENIRKDFVNKTERSTTSIWLMDTDSTMEKFMKLLTYYTNENENVMQGLCEQIESVMSDMSSQINKESMLSTDLHQASTRVSQLEEEINTLTTDCHTKINEISKLKLENEKLSNVITDITRKTNDIESELKGTTTTNYDLRDALNDAEKAILEFKARVRQLQTENERKADEIQAITNQSEQIRKKLSDSELIIEKNQTIATRVTAEKESLENIKRSLEGELERTRIEINGLRAQSKGTGDDGRVSFEIEKLLAAFGTTIDHLAVINPNSNAFRRSKGPDDNDRSVSVSESFLIDAMSTPSKGTPSKGGTPNKDKATPNKDQGGGVDSSNIAARVDYIIKRLGELRLWSRDELRVKRAMEDKVESLEKDTARNQSVIEEIQCQLKKAMATVTERDETIKARSKDMQDLTFELNNCRDQIVKFKLHDESRNEALEDEKKARSKYINDLHNKENDLAHIKIDLENSKKQCSKSQEMITQMKDKIVSLEREVDSKAELLRLAKANNSKLSITVEQLETGLEKDKKDREQLEKKLADAEVGLGSVNRWKMQITELEATTKNARELSKQAVEEKSVLEDKLGLSIREVEVLKKKVATADARVTSIQTEKNELEHELNELKSSLQKAKESYDEESSKRQLFEATLAAFKKNNDINIEAHLNKDTHDKAIAEEEEKRSLKSNITNLKIQCDEKESQRVEEANAKIRAENEVEKLKAMLEKASRELIVSNERASNLRGEGRKARKRIQESVGQIRDIVNIVRVDASSNGKDIATPAPKSKIVGFGEARDDAVPDVGFAEALGVSELTTALAALRESIVWLREDSHDKVEMQSTINSLQADKARLEAELQRIDKVHNEKTNKLREEINVLQAKLNANPNHSIVNPYASSNDGIASKKIAVLEARIQKEVQAKEYAVTETTTLREKIDKLSKTLREKNDESQNIGQINHESVDSLQKEVKVLKQELNTVNHHRNILKETTESLEKQLMKKIDVAVSADGNDKGAHVNSSFTEGNESIRKQLARFKARAQAMDELVNIYRASVLQLQSEGQFTLLTSNPKSFTDNNNIGCLEMEIAAVKKNYEEEIRLLELEVVDLHSKLKESNLYISELRKRFEETMKVMYRPGNSTNADILLSQLESIAKALDQSENNNQILTQSLASERQQSRRRVSTLVESLLTAQRNRDATLAALRQLEAHCVASGIEHFAVYEALRSELTSVQESSGRIKEENIEQQKAINKLLKGLIETDHELLEAERREKKRLKEKLKETHHQDTTATNTSNNSIHLYPPAPPFVVKHLDTLKSQPKSASKYDDLHQSGSISAYSFSNQASQIMSSPSSAVRDKMKGMSSMSAMSSPSIVRFDKDYDSIKKK